MRKRALRALSTVKLLVDCGYGDELFTSHESKGEGKHPLVLGEYFGCDQNIHRVWGFILHIQKIQSSIKTESAVDPDTNDWIGLLNC